MLACSGAATDAVDDSGAAAATAADLKTALGKTFDPTNPPHELTTSIPGTQAPEVESAYANDNFVAEYQVHATTRDVFLVLGNVVDADYELAVFDAKGKLLASGTYLGFQGAKWIWDATPQLTSHAGGGGDVDAVKTSVGASLDPTKPPTEYDGTLPGTDASKADASYANDNFVAHYRLSAADADVYVVLGNIVDADYELAVFDAKGKLLASGTYFGFQGAKWIWDAKAQTTSHAGH
jgi:hypothetical protein